MANIRKTSLPQIGWNVGRMIEETGAPITTFLILMAVGTGIGLLFEMAEKRRYIKRYPLLFKLFGFKPLSFKHKLEKFFRTTARLKQ